MKEELEENVKGNKDAISNLLKYFNEKLDEIKGVNANQSGTNLYRVTYLHKGIYQHLVSTCLGTY